jgi:hypothetical protein
MKVATLDKNDFVQQNAANTKTNIIHKASIAFKIKTSRRVSIIYGNCVHQINRPDNHSLGPEQSLDMEIACSESATVWTTGQHRPDVAQIRKEFQRNFGKPIA